MRFGILIYKISWGQSKGAWILFVRTWTCSRCVSLCFSQRYLLGHMFVVSMVSTTWLLVIWVAASSPRSHHCQRNWLRVWLREWCFVSYSSKLSSSKHQPCHIPASFLQKKRQHCSRKQKLRDRGNCELGGGFNCVLISPLVGEMVQSDRYVSDGLKPPTRFRLHMLDP